MRCDEAAGQIDRSIGVEDQQNNRMIGLSNYGRGRRLEGGWRDWSRFRALAIIQPRQEIDDICEISVTRFTGSFDLAEHLTNGIDRRQQSTCQLAEQILTDMCYSFQFFETKKSHCCLWGYESYERFLREFPSHEDTFQARPGLDLCGQGFRSFQQKTL